MMIFLRVVMYFGFLVAYISQHANAEQTGPATTMLFSGVSKDDITEIEAALADGADINARGPGRQTPLMHAVLKGSVKAVEYLLQHDADVSIPEKDGYTPMHGAGFQGRAEIAQLLIDHGIDARSVHSDGYEPIFRACWGREPRHTETVRVFLENGVPVDAVTKSGQTLFDAVKRNVATMKLLQEYQPQTEL